MVHRQSSRPRSCRAEMVLLPVVAIGIAVATQVSTLVGCRHGMIESW
jgi:hypothetical protein